MLRKWLIRYIESLGFARLDTVNAQDAKILQSLGDLAEHTVNDQIRLARAIFDVAPNDKRSAMRQVLRSELES